MMAQQSSSGIISNDFISLLNKNGKGVKPGTWNKKENHVIFAIWLGEKLGYIKMEHWYQITRKIIINNYGAGLLQSKYSGSPQMFLKCVFPNFEWLPWMFDGSAPNGYWDDIENHIKFANWLGEELGYTKMEDWYQITQRIIIKNHGSGCLNKYSGSPQMFLKSVFPHVEWVPWKFGMISMSYWDEKENHIKFANWLGEELGYTKMEDWYQITQRIIIKNHGRTCLKKYNDSPRMFLEGVFPHVEWLPWMFVSSSKCYWDEKENHIKFAIWLGEKLGYTKMEDWYQITQIVIYENGGGGLLQRKYKKSPLMFLKGVFPDIEWLPWVFGVTSTGYWDDIENHMKFANWLGAKLGYTKMDDWYQINAKVIQYNKGGGLLGTKYNHSPLMFLKGIFPDVEWLPWMFVSSAPNGYWNDIENHIKFANWLGGKLGYTKMDDWYKITTQVINENCGGGLLGTKYNDSTKLFVMTIYPEHTWVSSKFVKNYSQGQIEWLNYMILTIPDIIHAINNDNGEYSIPNTKYYADGFSESKNMILEYHGDYWHGNPKLFNQEELNSVTKTTYGELYQKTVKKQKFCQESGYKYISIWESDWMRGKKSIIKLQQKFKEKYCENV